MQTIRPSLYSPEHSGFDSVVTARNSSTWRNKAFDLTTRFVQFLRTHWRHWYRSQIQHATKRALSEIDDRMLKDIGIHRSQIDSVAITPMTGRISHRRRLIAYSSHLATTALDTELKNSTRRGAVIDDRCPGIGDEHTGLPYESHPSDSLSSTIVRAASKRYGPANAPWIDEAIKIRREDLF